MGDRPTPPKSLDEQLEEMQRDLQAFFHDPNNIRLMAEIEAYFAEHINDIAQNAQYTRLPNIIQAQNVALAATQSPTRFKHWFTSLATALTMLLNMCHEIIEPKSQQEEFDDRPLEDTEASERTRTIRELVILDNSFRDLTTANTNNNLPNDYIGKQNLVFALAKYGLLKFIQARNQQQFSNSNNSGLTQDFLDTPIQIIYIKLLEHYKNQFHLIVNTPVHNAQLAQNNSFASLAARFRQHINVGDLLLDLNTNTNNNNNSNTNNNNRMGSGSSKKK